MPRIFLALAAFFVSGAAALLYQVIWQRLLVFFSGADVYSASVVVAAFMAGMGCGSFIGGQVADRVSQTTSLALFAIAELSVAIFGVLSSAFFYDFLYTRFGHLEIGLATKALVLFAGLLWPTIFMGASLPLLARGLTTDVGRAAPTVGWLYAFNTLGAAMGALAGTWLLLPQVGLEAGLKIAGSMNVLCAVAAVPLVVWRQSATAPGTGGETRAPVFRRATPVPRGISVWIALFAMSGFLAVSLEIVWFRVLGVALKSTSFTFGTLLAVYLSGLAIGSGVGSAIAERVSRPAFWFLVLQAGAGLYAAVSVTVFAAALPLFGSLAAYLGQYDGVDVGSAIAFWRGLNAEAGAAAREFLRMYFVLPVLLVGPPTFMTGISFPLLQRVVQTDLEWLGRRVGALLTANVAGSTMGAFVAGLLFLDWLGTAGTLKLLYAMSVGFAVLAVRMAQFQRRWLHLGSYGGLAAIVVVLLLALPDGQTLWARLHGAPSGFVIQGEDGSGLSVLKSEGGDFRRTVVYANGLGQSWIPYGGIHTVLGALPAFVHPNPRTAVLIGLGSGDTLFAMAGRPELERIMSVEIVGPQLGTLQQLRARDDYQGLSQLLRDPRIRHVTGDGRLFLRRAREGFDIVQADALRAQSAYAGNLYSDAYFSLVREHLNPGGLAVTFAPTLRTLRTFDQVFAHVWFSGGVAIGSDRPIPIPFEREEVERRLSDPRVHTYYSSAGIDIRELLREYLRADGRLYKQSLDPSAIDDVNTDLYPRDEFDIPALIRVPFIGSR